MTLKIREQIIHLIFISCLTFALTTSLTAEVFWEGSQSPDTQGFDWAWTGYEFAWHPQTNEQGSELGVTYFYSGPSTSSGSSIKLPDSTASAELSRAAGWTLSFRVKPLQNTSDEYGSVIVVEDNVGAITVKLNSDELIFAKGNYSASQTHSITSSTFVEVKLTMAAAGSDVSIYINSALAGTLAADIQNQAKPALSIGDGSSGSLGEAVYSYVALNASSIFYWQELNDSGIWGSGSPDESGACEANYIVNGMARSCDSGDCSFAIKCLQTN